MPADSFFEALLALEGLDECESSAEEENERGSCCACGTSEAPDEDQRTEGCERARAVVDAGTLIRGQADRVTFALDWASGRMSTRIVFEPSLTCQGVGGFAHDDIRCG